MGERRAALRIDIVDPAGRRREHARSSASTAPSMETSLLLVVALHVPPGQRQQPSANRDPVRLLSLPGSVVLAIAALYRLGHTVRERQPWAAVLGAVLVLSWFGLLEDFGRITSCRSTAAKSISTQHVARGKLPLHGARRRARRHRLAHQNAKPPTDLVVSGQGIAGLAFYYPDFDFVFLDPGDQRLLAWACQLGTVDRWSNLPLVFSVAELRARIAASPSSFLVVDSGLLDSVLADLDGLNPRGRLVKRLRLPHDSVVRGFCAAVAYATPNSRGDRAGRVQTRS